LPFTIVPPIEGKRFDALAEWQILAQANDVECRFFAEI
jgi:hypothetical protein